MIDGMLYTGGIVDTARIFDIGPDHLEKVIRTYGRKLTSSQLAYQGRPKLYKKVSA